MDELTEKEKRISELQNESVLQYCGGSSPYLWIIPFVACIALVVLWILIRRTRSVPAAGGLLLLVPAPIYLGALAMLDGIVASCDVIERSGTQPAPADVVSGLGYSISWLTYGVRWAIPGFVLAVVSMMHRTGKSENASNKSISSAHQTESPQSAMSGEL